MEVGLVAESGDGEAGFVQGLDVGVGVVALRAGAEDLVFVDEEGQLGFLAGEIEDLAVEVLEAGALVEHVGAAPGDGVIDDVPLDDAVFHEGEALGDTGEGAVANGGGVGDFLEVVGRGDLHEVVAAHGDVAFGKPGEGFLEFSVAGGFALGVEVGGPVAVFEVVFEDDDAEEAVDEVAIPAVVIGGAGEAFGDDGGAEAELVAAEGKSDFGVGEGFPLGVFEGEGEIGFAVFFDAVEGGFAPGGVGLAARVGALDGFGFGEGGGVGAGGVLQDADAFDFDGLLFVGAEQDDGGGVGGDGLVGEEGDGEFEPIGMDAEADGGAEGGVGSGAQLEFGKDFAMGSAADDAGFDDGEDGFVFGDGVGDGGGELGCVRFGGVGFGNGDAFAFREGLDGAGAVVGAGLESPALPAVGSAGGQVEGKASEGQEGEGREGEESHGATDTLNRRDWKRTDG